MKLYYSTTSPYVRKCLIAAHELGLMDRIEIASIATLPTAHHAELMRQNPLCKVPTLILEDGTALYDSRVIAEYLNSLAKGSLLASGDARWEVLVRQSLADGILDAGLLMRYEVALRPKEFQWASWSQGQEEKVMSAVRHFEATARDWTDRIDMGSIALASALSYLDLRFAELKWRDTAPALKSWMSAFNERPSMRETQFKV
ncbi:Glutathione S-transferase OS=Castellaniella defragrans OX=75697 GN=HNR28_000814 PE=4 SV=1 [Castellaniella defragrans]